MVQGGDRIRGARIAIPVDLTFPGQIAGEELCVSKFYKVS